MKLSPHATFVRPVTIPQLARQIGVPRRTLFRKLHAWHRADRARGDGHAHWLFRPTRGPWSVNLYRLRAEHPELFGVPPAEEVYERLQGCEGKVSFATKQINALKAAFREHKRQHDGQRQRERRSTSEPPAA